jgi:hypothetical protein
MTVLYSDAPIAGSSFDACARAPVAARLVELASESIDQPLVVGLVGAAGAGKTSVLQMTGEVCAARAELRAFAIDAWVAGDAAKVNEAFVVEVSRIFEEEGVTSGVEKLRDKLFVVGDVVSAVARFAGAKVDVKGALERAPDKLREEILEHAQKIGKRIVVLVDHVDRMPPADAVAVVKLIARWGTFPYFAFVLAFDRAELARKLRRIEGSAADLARVVAVELALPPIDRAALAAFVRGGLVDIARAGGVDPSAALALFDVEVGVGLVVVDTLRDAKRLLNAVSAALPLVAATIDLRTLVLVELVRRVAPAAFPIVVDRLRLGARASLAGELAQFAARCERPAAAAAVFAEIAR